MIKTIILYALLIFSVGCKTNDLPNNVEAMAKKDEAQLNNTFNSASASPQNNSQPDKDKTVQPQSDEGKTVRVKFARGKSSAEYKDIAVRGTTNDYIVEARAGQKMTVRLRPENRKNSPSFVIIPPQGSQQLEQERGDYWSGKLPETGEYIIEVVSGFGNTGYMLNIEVR